MESRYRIQRKKRRLKTARAFIGLIIVCVILGSSMSIVSADQDIQSMLSNWFDKKSEESITKIDEEISREQEAQTDRLKDELNTKIQDADKQLDKFTKTEAEKAVSELEQYADTLLADLDIDNTTAKNEAAEELASIVENAKNQMANVKSDIEPEKGEEKTGQSGSGDDEDISDEPAEKPPEENHKAEKGNNVE